MKRHKPALIVHGGAGHLPETDLRERIEGCRKAALVAWPVLEEGGSALDAVQRAVMALEDDPLFNAGVGSVLNVRGTVEMDASIMDGLTLEAGAVGSVQGVRNPILLARRIMESGGHVLLAGDGAREFARAEGIPECATEDLTTARQRQRWEREHGTVGCVALDEEGRVAAGTSTGGLFDKLPGRIGDSALVGCGTYAEPAGGASCTGQGEAIIRTVLAKTAVDLLKAGLSSHKAARRAIMLLEEKTHAEAGLILIDEEGRIGYAHNTAYMPVCHVHAPDEVVTDA